MDTIRWGVIGCGNVVEHKSGPPLYRTPNSEMVAVMRRDASKAEDFARRHDVKHWYTDVKALLAHPDVNAIYIASPHYMHLEHVTLAAQTHKIILCEKPMGTSAAQAQAIVDVCKQNNVSLNVAYYRRYWHVTRVIKRLLGEKSIGRIVQARAQLADYFVGDVERPWLTSRAQSGGSALANAGSHWVDLMRYFLGDIVEVMAYCSSKTSGWEIEDTVNAEMLARDGVPISLLITQASPVKINEIDILGTDGRISSSSLYEGFWKLERPGKQTELIQFTYSSTPHSEFITELVPALVANQPPLIPGEEAVAVWKIMEAMYRSCASGTRIKVE